MIKYFNSMAQMLGKLLNRKTKMLIKQMLIKYFNSMAQMLGKLLNRKTKMLIKQKIISENYLINI